MKSYSRVFLTILLGLIHVVVLAQDEKNTQNQNSIKIYIDQVGFKNIENLDKTYQEIYLSILNSQLSYMKTGTRFLAGTKIKLQITNSSGNQIDQKSWESISEVDNMEQANQQIGLEIAGFMLEPGRYSLMATITDLNSGVKSESEKTLLVPSFKGTKVQLSEIELAQSIQRAEQKNKFVKNNIEVLPIPTRVIGLNSPFLYFYTEMYNLTESAEYTKEFSVVDNRGNIVEFSEKPYLPKSENSIWIEKIKLLQQASGKYTLRLKLIKKKAKEIAFRETEFWLSNPNKVIAASQLSEQDVEEFRSLFHHLVDNKQLQFYDALNKEGKIEYINKFWKERTPEFKKQHLERFYAAQKTYGSANTPGWKSDRGRVLIMYGAPDDIEREPASLNSRAYEMWIFESLPNQGQVVFVFVDFGIFGNYELVHSTIKSSDRMEIYDPEWREKITIAR